MGLTGKRLAWDICTLPGTSESALDISLSITVGALHRQ
jgi:hypothetical protein